MGGRKGAERDEEEGGGEHGCVVLLFLWGIKCAKETRDRSAR